jgi:D-methionine transport system substrate-binding protein
MKKNSLISIIALILLAIIATACAPAPTTNIATTLKVGATPVPHADLLNLVKEDLAQKGITLEIVEFTDYVQPNLALNQGDLHANFFQHVPYLERFSKEHNLSLEAIGAVHVEPLGLYSQKAQNLEQLPQGAQIAIPADAVNGGRALILLHSAGLITLKDSTNLEATEKDIEVNTHAFKFIPVEAAQLPRVLQDVDAAVINGNYAIEAGFVPTQDAILLEGSKSPYANIIVTRSNASDTEREALAELVAALQSEKVKTFILDTYKGGVVPAF